MKGLVQWPSFKMCVGYILKFFFKVNPEVKYSKVRNCTGVRQVIRIMTANPNSKQPLPAKYAHFTYKVAASSFFMLHDKKSEFWCYLAGGKRGERGIIQ